MAKVVKNYGHAKCILVEPANKTVETSWKNWRQGYTGMEGKLRLFESLKKYPGQRFLYFIADSFFQGMGFEEPAYLKTSYGTESLEGDLLTFCTINTRYTFRLDRPTDEELTEVKDDVARYTRACFTRDPEDDRRYDIFFALCRKFDIQWPKASDKERAFITEMTRVAYEVDLARREGRPVSDIKHSFTGCGECSVDEEIRRWVAWEDAKGLLQADGLQPSLEMQMLIEQEISGEISAADIKAFLDNLYDAAVEDAFWNALDAKRKEAGEEDPFYSKANQAYLEQTIADIEAGRAKLVEHDLIEV